MSPEYSKKNLDVLCCYLSLQMPLLSHHMTCHAILSVLKINLYQKGMFSGQLNQSVILSRQFFLLKTISQTYLWLMKKSKARCNTKASITIRAIVAGFLVDTTAVAHFASPFFPFSILIGGKKVWKVSLYMACKQRLI